MRTSKEHTSLNLAMAVTVVLCSLFGARSTKAARTPGSPLVGRTLRGIGFRERYGLQVLGLNRHGRNLLDKLSRAVLRVGDVLVAEGPPSLVVPAVAQVDWLAKVEGFTVTGPDGGVLVARRRDTPGPLVTPDVWAVLDEVGEGEGPLRLVIHRKAEVKALAPVEVPGFGWTTWRPGHLAPTVAGADVAPVTADGTTLANGLVSVEVDTTDGTFGIDGHRGLGRLVDGGDWGDTYNWCPPATDTLVDRPDTVTVEVAEPGPLRARLAVTATYRWPATSGPERREGEVAHAVRTLLELRAGEPFVRVETTIDNRSRDHRLRAHFPLPEPADRSRAECAYAVVERGLDAEGGPTETPLPTYPAQRFVQAGGLTVVHDGVTEYELVAISGGRADELAITLLRSTGMLSQGPMPTRPLPAGPLTPVEGAQLRLVTLDGKEAGIGEEGEIRAKGPQVTVGYLDPSLDAAAFDEDGWFRTGDLGRFDEAGNLTITGRLKDVIIRKGENISAKEVEDLLFTHPQVADVAVVGLADDERGERVCAVVVTAPGEADITFEEMGRHLLDAGLITRKLPEQLEVVDALPRNPSGKIVKFELRDRFAGPAPA